MLNRTMTVEQAAMRNKNVIPKLIELGIEYDFVATEKIETVLKDNDISFEDFQEMIGETNIYADLDKYRDYTKEEIIKMIVTEIHPKELSLVEEIDNGFSKAIKKYYRECGEQLFVIYEIVLLIKAELVSHFSSEEEYEFKEALKNKDVDYENLLAEHEKIIGLLDRIKVLTHSYNLNLDIEEVKEIEAKMKELDIHSRRHIYIENEILFKM